MTEETFTLYLDESGNDTLYSEESHAKDPNLETHCTLVGVIIRNDRKDLLKEEFGRIKLALWNSNEVIFHSVKIRAKKGYFAIFHYKPELYGWFKAQLNLVTELIEPVIICSSLNKLLWIKKYPRKLKFNDDPYCEAFIYLLERYAHFLNSKGARGRIIVEQRDSRQNTLLKEIYEYTKKNGTQYIGVNVFDSISGKLEFKKKNMNLPGLQFADYCCYPFYIDHKHPERENEHYMFLEQFVYPGDRKKYGHKKWPI